MSGTTPVDKTLGNNVRRKNIGDIQYVVFPYAQETYKNEGASLTCIISPIHGAQDVSLTPFTHSPFVLSLSLPDTARHSACTRFFSNMPTPELILIFCFTLWQFINADSSHGSLHRSRLRLLRALQRDVVHDLPLGWTPVGCHLCVILQVTTLSRELKFLT